MTSHGSTPRTGPTLSPAATAPGVLSTNDLAKETNQTHHKEALRLIVGGLGQGKGFTMKSRVIAKIVSTPKDADK